MCSWYLGYKLFIIGQKILRVTNKSIQHLSIVEPPIRESEPPSKKSLKNFTQSRIQPRYESLPIDSFKLGQKLEQHYFKIVDYYFPLNLFVFKYLIVTWFVNQRIYSIETFRFFNIREKETTVELDYFFFILSIDPWNWSICIINRPTNYFCVFVLYTENNFGTDKFGELSF